MLGKGVPLINDPIGEKVKSWCDPTVPFEYSLIMTSSCGVD